MQNPTFDYYFGHLAPTTSTVNCDDPNVMSTNANSKCDTLTTRPTDAYVTVNRPVFYAHDYLVPLKSTSASSHLDPFSPLTNSDEVTSSPNSCPRHRSHRGITGFCIQGLCPDQKRVRSSSRTLWRFVCSIFPILHWLPRYDVRENLLSDLVTGMTILALHIPQGLAYGRLAGVEPIYGLFVSLFPVIIYSLMGTSRQISIGTFAVVSIACRDILNNYKIPVDQTAGLGNITAYLDTEMVQFNGQKLRPIEVLTSLALLVGLIQFVIGSLRLGILAILLSDPVVSSFVVGSSMHVFTSQVFAFLGIDSSDKGKEAAIPFVLVRIWVRLLKRLPTANPVTIALSVSTIAVLLLCKNILEPYLTRRYRLRNLALPIDILCIIVLTSLSYAFELNRRFSVDIIPKISTGFQNIPAVPRVDLWPNLFTSALLLAFVIYVSTYSLEKMFAARYGYEVSANQELLALGTANIVSSFLMCYPCSGSLSRSAVQDKVGGKTQLASLISSLLIVVFILYLSTYLETLPKCALSCIIIVALIGTMCKFSDLFYYWRLSKMDGILWACTFTFVVLFGVDRGLLYGLTLSFAFLMIRLSIPVFNLKDHVPNSEVYLSRPPPTNQTSEQAKEKSLHCCTTIPGVIVFEFHGPLIFLNVESFKKRFTRMILRPIKAQLEEIALLNLCSRMQNTTSKTNSPRSSALIDLNSNLDTCGALKYQFNDIRNCVTPVHSVVFDCGRVTYLDIKGVEVLLEMAAELAKLGSIQLLLASCSDIVLQTLGKSHFFDKFHSQQCFVTVHDAVTAVANNTANDNNNLITIDQTN